MWVFCVNFDQFFFTVTYQGNCRIVCTFINISVSGKWTMDIVTLRPILWSGAFHLYLQYCLFVKSTFGYIYCSSVHTVWYHTWFEYSTYIKFQIFIVVTSWVFTELIIIFCLRLKDFIRKIPRLHGSLKFSVAVQVWIRMDGFYLTFLCTIFWNSNIQGI